eukprot:CAMPEP_0119557640 /NCGR_PEP_ID=MMETSP1352-20130426/9249_1 /TAXON_ID=265584 /ORGANISM="Stauroneis constricta, Strain CCMP1120" /LENGTH=834 /DNA_ID=CAMNT_0007604777 /DNA_START=262 /DNA_END=2766 /DNA_ORIENTATION=-
MTKVHKMGPTNASNQHLMGNDLSRLGKKVFAGSAVDGQSQKKQETDQKHPSKSSKHGDAKNKTAISQIRTRTIDTNLSPDSAAKKEIENHVMDRKIVEGVDAFPSGGLAAVSKEALARAKERDQFLEEQARKQREANLKRVRRPRFRANPYGHMVEPQMIAAHSHEKPPERPPNKQREQVLKAYLEPIDKSTWKTRPLPIRTTTAEDLTETPFPQLNSCRFLPSQWPVDEFPYDDPFLPWIHDVFPTHEGDFIQFVAQNKRRCRTGTTPDEEEALDHWEPQVTQFQHVPLKRLNTTFTKTPRYRLSSHEEADKDAMTTRFICRFKDADGEVLEETMSLFNNDYEWATCRKKLRSMFSPDGRNLNSPHTSQLIFKCPVPSYLQEKIRTGESVVDDWATLFIDLVPVRTPPRYGPPSEFLSPFYGDARQKGSLAFDTDVHWGKQHILPKVEDSGRWENIPICRPSLMEYEEEAYEKSLQVKSADEKPHHLVSCLWASTGYTTRGNRFAINDGQRRLLEWITYNGILGFDHFYIYDNSGAFSNTSSLQPIADLFPGKVTVIPWPSKVCNNNPNNVDSPGERSSQYAAETSCRLRFGPHVNWIGQFDIDEYLVPMGNYDSVLPLLSKLDEENMKIISFASWRAWPRRTHMETPVAINDKELCESREECFELTIPNNVTVLAAYNCDRQPPGKKTKSMPAEKQIYRADYVKQHFIHYSTITETTNLNNTEYGKRFGHQWAFPDPLSRFANELTEGLMLHSKAIARQDTAGWLTHCNIKGGGKGTCRVGYPWPKGAEERNETTNADGWKYNCYVNDKIDEFWVPKLEAALSEHSHLLANQ